MNEYTPFVIPDQPYFTLPLAALPALRDSREPTALASNLISLAVVRMAKQFQSIYSVDEMEELECAKSYDCVTEWRERNQILGEDRTHIALACLFLNVNTRSLPRIESEAMMAEMKIRRFDYKTNVIFSVQCRDLWTLRDGEIPLKDFLVLAAIRSILGIKAKSVPPRRITREQIAARIGGYSRKVDIHPNARKKLLNEPNLKRIGRTADKLAKQERFTRWTAFKRETYYHVSKSESEIADYVAKKKGREAERRISGLKAEIESKTRLQALRHEEQTLRDTLSKLK